MSDLNRKFIVRDPKNGAFFITRNLIKLEVETDKKGNQLKCNQDVINLLIHKNDPKYTKLSAFLPTRDFFGLHEDLSNQDKKKEIIDNYTLIFRFSIIKLSEYISKETFIILLMQYLNETSMKRIHSRSILAKHKEAYYRVVENFFNFSEIE